MKEQKFIPHVKPKLLGKNRFQKLSSNQSLKTGPKIIVEQLNLHPV
jgi:hypothetical protein